MKTELVAIKDGKFTRTHSGRLIVGWASALTVYVKLSGHAAMDGQMTIDEGLARIARESSDDEYAVFKRFTESQELVNMAAIGGLSREADVGNDESRQAFIH